MTSSLRWLVFCALLTPAVRADSTVVLPGSQGPTSWELFNHKDLSGWSFVTSKGEPISQVARVTPEGVLSVTGKPTGYLLVDKGKCFVENYRLHVEYRWLKAKGNSGIFVHISSGPVGGKPWPLCLQIQNRDQHTGELIPMGGFTFAGGPPDGKIYALRKAPKENPIGEWNTCDITCDKDTVEVMVNGVVQNRAEHCSARRGQIGLQLEGPAFEIREVRQTEINPLVM